MLIRSSVLVAALVTFAPPVVQAQSEPWCIITPPQASIVLARDGSLIGEIGRESRTSVSFRTLPAYVGQAFVAIEDQRFYKHDGMYVIGIASAIRDIHGLRMSLQLRTARTGGTSTATPHAEARW